MFNIAFEILTIIILLTALLAGWWFLWQVYRDKTGLDSDFINSKAERRVSQLVDDFKQELSLINTDLAEIKKLLSQLNQYEN